MIADELSGVVVPIITPLDDEDRVDEQSLRKVLRYLIEAGVHGIFTGGSAGEGPLLVTREWERMVQIVFEEGHGRVHLLAGAMDTSTTRVLEKVRILAQIGYGAFVVTPTFYVALKSPDEHLRHFGTCKENSCGIEMIAYNIPQSTGSMIPLATMLEMAERGWIRYCKESSEQPDYFNALISRAADCGLRVFQGAESIAIHSLLLGACGLVPCCANVDPKTFIDAYNAVPHAKADELCGFQQRITALRTNLVQAGDCWLAGIKYAMASRGMCSGRMISPLQPLNNGQKARIDAFLSNEVAAWHV